MNTWLSGVRSAILALVSAAAFAAPAQAEPAQSIAVNCKDLDFSRAEDIARLHRRIHKAARQVCNPQQLDIFLPEMRSYSACYRLTVDDATAQVDRFIRAKLSTSARP
jgi:UrcA family protein